MDSINKNQKEDNLKDVYGQEAIEKIKELAKKAGSFFSAQRSRPGSHSKPDPWPPKK
jgi:hypothetical protein